MPVPPAHQHVCLVYDEAATFLGAARAFLAEGVRAGQRVVFVGPPQAYAGLGIDGLPHFSTADVDAGGVPVTPHAQVTAYRAFTEAAVADGFTGLRVVAEATPLVRTAAQLDAFLRYEHLVDRYMSEHPMAAMCAPSTVASSPSRPSPAWPACTRARPASTRRSASSPARPRAGRSPFPANST
ncbi:MEDS domain-containing protein [Phytohabitans houttuyneae]|uniref:MEDS domain-containing protein n=1 Tax=Phytohabitans houttuyneae TaxID=1076126 RepID=UPI0015655FF9|nr:MEDS domain-containing protein [Phytohabitans houttuyneae]